MLDQLFTLSADPPALIYSNTVDRLRHFSEKNRMEPMWDWLLSFVKRDSRQIVICGAGEFGEAVCHLLLHRRKRVAYMVDRDPAVQNRSVGGIGVFPLDKIAHLSSATHKAVIATVDDVPLYEETLLANGFVSGHDFMHAFAQTRTG